jgi:hypothetical protein
VDVLADTSALHHHYWHESFPGFELLVALQTKVRRARLDSLRRNF